MSDLQQLSQTGSNIFAPFTTQIVSILSEMQQTINALTLRVETLEKQKSNKEPSSDKPSTAFQVIIASQKKGKTPTKSKEEMPVKFRNDISKPRGKEKAKSNRQRHVIQNSDELKTDEKEQTTATAAATETNEVKAEEPAPVIEEPKPIPKVRGAKKKINWSFDRNHKIFKETDNGNGALKPESKSGTILFGSFLSSKDTQFACYQIKFDTRALGSVGSGYAFGVITKEFHSFTSTNMGNNGSCMVKGNGQLIASDGFVTGPTKNKQMIPMFKDNGLCTEGDIVVVDVDMESLTMQIWNDTTNDGNVFEIQFPDKPIAIVVYMSGSKKRKIVVSEQWAFKPSES